MKLGPRPVRWGNAISFDQQNVEFTDLAPRLPLIGGVTTNCLIASMKRYLPKFFAREGGYIVQQLAECNQVASREIRQHSFSPRAEY
jgi:hypothetical protein